MIGNSNFLFESNKLLTEMLVFLLFKKESKSDYLLTIETKELNTSEESKKKVDMICKFAYVKPHIITINKIDYLMFAECDDIYKDYNDELRDENRKLHNLFKCNATNY